MLFDIYFRACKVQILGLVYDFIYIVWNKEKKYHQWTKNSVICPDWGANSRPSDYETDALSTALTRQYYIYNCWWYFQKINLSALALKLGFSAAYLQELLFCQTHSKKQNNNAFVEDSNVFPKYFIRRFFLIIAVLKLYNRVADK